MPARSVKVTVIVAGDEMTIDLSELPEEIDDERRAQRRRPNGGAAGVPLSDPAQGDANEGSFRPLKLVLPEGTVMSAGPTSAKGHYNSALPTLIDLVIRALGSPCRTASRPVISPRSRRPFAVVTWQPAFFQCSDSGFGGWGALCDTDGPGPIPHDVPW